MPNVYAPWAYNLGDDRNPHNGCIRDSRGHMLNCRATINETDAAQMRLMTSAPALHKALSAMVRKYALPDTGYPDDSPAGVARSLLAFLASNT